MASTKEKRQLFAAKLLANGFNQKQAAIDAGYSERRAAVTGCNLMKHPDVIEYLQKHAPKIQEQCEVDALYVLRGAKEMFERCMQHFPVLDKKGDPVLVETPTGEIAPAYAFDSAGAGKALKLLGEHVKVSAFKPLDESGKPVDQNWRITFVDAKTGRETVFDSGSSK